MRNKAPVKAAYSEESLYDCEFYCKSLIYRRLKVESVKIKNRINHSVTDSVLEFICTNYDNRNISIDYKTLSDGVVAYRLEVQRGEEPVVADCLPSSETKKIRRSCEMSDSFTVEGHRMRMEPYTYRISLFNMVPKERVSVRLRYTSQLTVESFKASGNNQETKVVPLLITPPRFEHLIAESDPWNKDDPFKVDAIQSYRMVPSTNKSKMQFVEQTLVKNLLPNGTLCRVMDDKTSMNTIELFIDSGEPFASNLLYESGSDSHENLTSYHCLMAQFKTQFENYESTCKTPSDLIFIVENCDAAFDTGYEIGRICMKFFLSKLGSHQRFQVIESNEAFSRVFQSFVEANETNVQTAMDYIDNMQRIRGDCGYYEVLKDVYDNEAAEGNSDRLTNIIYIGRGIIHQIHEDSRKACGLVKMNAERARVFTVGVDPLVNRPLLVNFAAATGGRATFVAEESQREVRLTKLFEDICRPPAKNVKVNWNLQKIAGEGVSDPVEVLMMPERVPTVFHDNMVTVYGLIKPDDISSISGQVNLEYEFDDKPHQVIIQLDGEKGLKEIDYTFGKNMVLHKLAADSLCSQLFIDHAGLRYAETVKRVVTKNLKAKIAALAMTFDVDTRFTSRHGIVA